VASHRRVLDARDDRVPLLGGGGSRQTKDGQIVGFRPAARKHYLARRRPDQVGHTLAGLLQLLTRRVAECVQRRRVTPPSAKVRKHRLEDARVERSSGTIVQIDRIDHDLA